MSYDLVVWDGEPPTDDAAAEVVFHEFMDSLEAGYDEPPLPSITEYADVLAARWPDGDDSPWASWPLLQDGVGPLVHLQIRPERADDVVAFAALAAHSQGLVCFDPQTERLV